MAGQQLTYSRSFAAAIRGQVSDSNPKTYRSLLNKSGGALAAGVGLVRDATSGEATTPSDNSHALVGIAALHMATDPNFIAGSANYREGSEMVVLVEGSIWVPVEQTVTPADPVFVRFASGSGTELGAFRKDGDTNTARAVYGARWVTGGALGSVAELYFSASVDNAQIAGI